MGLLFETKPLIVNVSLAELIGLNEALVLQQIHYWLDINSKADKNHFEGKYWTYNTVDDWNKEFPFYSRSTVVRTIKALRELGILITGNFNKRKGDRTLWYSIDYKKLDALEEQKKQEKIDMQHSQQVDENNEIIEMCDNDIENTTIHAGLDHHVKMTQPLCQIAITIVSN